MKEEVKTLEVTPADLVFARLEDKQFIQREDGTDVVVADVAIYKVNRDGSETELKRTVVSLKV